MDSMVSIKMANAYGGSAFRYVDMVYNEIMAPDGRRHFRFGEVQYEDKLSQQMVKHLTEALGTDAMYLDRGAPLKAALLSREPEAALKAAATAAMNAFFMYQSQWHDVHGGYNDREALKTLDRVDVQRDPANPQWFHVSVYGTTVAGSPVEAGTVVTVRTSAPGATS